MEQMSRSIIEKSKADYSTTVMVYQPPPLPARVVTTAIRDLSKISASENLLQRLFKVITEKWSSLIAELKQSFDDTTLLRRFMSDMEDLKSSSNLWEKIGNLTYDILKTVFTDRRNKFMQTCIAHLGREIAPIIEIMFTSDATKELIVSSVLHLLKAACGAASGYESLDWLEWLIEWILIILKWILFLLITHFISMLSPSYELLKSFLKLVLPLFLNWIFKKIKDARMKPK